MADRQIVSLRPEYVEQCASIHLRAFPDFFLSRLGPRFISEFYRAFLDEPDAISGVALDDEGRVLGVVVGTKQPHGFFARLLKQRWHAFTLASITLAVRHPAVVPRLLRAVLYRGEVPLPVGGALLSSICVDLDSQGASVGSNLLRHFMSAVQTAGIPAYLTTDRVDNDSTNSFYLRHGWHLVGSYKTPEGRSMNCYALDVLEE